MAGPGGLHACVHSHARLLQAPASSAPLSDKRGERSATHVHDKGDAHLQACRKEVRKALLLHRRAPFKTPLRCLYKVSCEFGRSECG
jgi:hypothetical protein